MNPNKALWEKGDFTEIAAFMRQSERVDLSGLDFAYCAPSFSEFLYRFWIENEIWFALEDDASRRPLNALELNYVRHYNGSNDRTAAAMSFFFLLPISSVTNTESQPRIPCLERSNLTMDTFGSWSASPFSRVC